LPSLTAIVLTVIAILAVARASAAGGDVAANLVAALAALAALVALSAMSDGGRQKSTQNESPVQPQIDKAAQDRAYAELLQHENKGIVKRFSERNGWGLISCDICEEASGSAPESKNPGQPRRDVRIYRKEAEALSLRVGDVVWFRAVADDDAPGWLKAVSIQREPSESPGDGAAIRQTILEEESAPLEDEDTLQSRKMASQDALDDGVGEASSSTAVAPETSSVEIDRERPATTTVVARRLVHHHLEVPLCEEHRAEEKDFWSSSSNSSPSKRSPVKSQQEEEAPTVAPAPAKPLRRQPLATLRAATAQDGLPLLLAAAAAGKDSALR
jgi:hypothetical protein